MKLYSYWRSSTSYRVRIALHLKGIAHEIVPVNLLNGEQNKKDYHVMNPMKAVPGLMLADGRIITQSQAILRYLDKAYPTPPLWPDDPVLSARAEAAALVIATDIHPVHNLKVINHLKQLDHGQTDITQWVNYWIRDGLKAFLQLIDDGAYSFGDEVSLADICLIPQLYVARRWGTNLQGLSRLTEIEKNCLEKDEFQKAHPDNQIDCPQPVTHKAD